MNKVDVVEVGRLFMDKYDKPTPLFLTDAHAIYWLGYPEDSAFRCNTYLVVDGQEAIIVDPGGAETFDFIVDRVRQIIPVESVNAMIVCHQDPDVAAAIVPWLDLNPQIKIITSIRTNILLPHYGRINYTFVSINDTLEYHFLSGNRLRFVEAPFLHFPGAFTTIDVVSGYLFSGDIWAAIDMGWKLVVDDFHKHELKLNLFHVDYMANNLACRGFLRNLGNFFPEAILPQHGSVIPAIFVPKALDYIRKLKCGTDLIYAGL
jgi:flavorubredoxin